MLIKLSTVYMIASLNHPAHASRGVHLGNPTPTLHLHLHPKKACLTSSLKISVRFAAFQQSRDAVVRDFQDKPTVDDAVH